VGRRDFITTIDIESDNVGLSVTANHDAGLVVMEFDIKDDPTETRVYVGLGKDDLQTLRANLDRAERELEEAKKNG
jgi:hypothetical protein